MKRWYRGSRGCFYQHDADKFGRVWQSLFKRCNQVLGPSGGNNSEVWYGVATSQMTEKLVAAVPISIKRRTCIGRKNNGTAMPVRTTRNMKVFLIHQRIDHSCELLEGGVFFRMLLPAP